MLKYQKTKRILSLVMSIFMVMGCFAPKVLSENMVYAAQNEELLSQARANLAEVAMNKIESQVMDDFENDDLVEVMIYMNSQIDTEMVAYESQKALSATISPYQTKLQVRRNVVEALKDNAETSQEKVISYLNNEMEKGNVEDFQSYIIVNMLYVKATKEVIENLAYMAEVEKIYKNKTHTLDYVKNNDDVQPAANGVEWNISQIRADEVWGLGYNGTGVVVANIDSGVDWTHPALMSKWRGWYPSSGLVIPSGNWFDPVYNAALPMDSDEHGTHVMGTMVGQDPSGINKIGVAPGAKWIAARVFNTAGSTTDAILLSAADWMLHPGGNPDMAPDVINNSWGGGAGLDSWYRDAVRAWRSAGIVPVFSAGNQRVGEPLPGPGSISVPSNYPESIAVAALDRNNKLASFSKLGPSPYDPTMIKPNLSAGGVNVRSSVPGNGYDGTFSGTSMSAPAVSGAAALLLSANASLSVDEIQELLQNTAVPLTDYKYPTAPNMGYGHGIIDVFEAVSLVSSGNGYVSGRVLVQGEDITEATIEHEQEVSETNLNEDIEIIARITDDVAVTEVELLVKQQGKSYWMVAPMNRISGDHKDGRYKGIISADMIAGEQITYKIKVRDYAGDVVVSSDYNITVIFGVIPGEYTQGFEEDMSDWTIGGCWEWGAPSKVGPTAYEGEKLVATALDRNYPNSANSWLITPPIDLRDTSLQTALLKFHEWYNIKVSDFGNLLITNDFGATWTPVRPAITDVSSDWKESVVNLNKYLGSQNPVFVAFNFTSDTAIQGLGWYIDNVRLVATDYDVPEIPTNLTAVAGLEGIKLNWNHSSDADLDHYNIYRSETAGEGYIKIAEATVNSYIDSEVVVDTTYYYVISSEDFSRNESTYSEEASATAIGVVTIFSTDFEENDGGFVTEATRGTNPWEWGVPRSGPMAAASGEKLWATNLSGKYPNNVDAYIETPAIVIPEGKEGVLVFNHWVDTEATAINFYDYGQVLISNDDGETWTNITPTYAEKYGRRDRVWSNQEITLSGYTGETVKIRFLFHSDSSTAYDGWYIDDVSVTLIDYVAPESDTVDGEDDFSPAKFNYIINRASQSSAINTIEDKDVQNMPMIFAGIPSEDTVLTIKETGRSIKPDPITGKYSVKIPVGTYTLLAEAYGYYPLEKTVEVLDDQTTKLNFILEAIPQGTIAGQVVDMRSGAPAAHAVIKVVENSKIAPVTADENGNFVITNVYEGVYTLEVVAEGFESGEATVTVVGNETTELTIRLKRFVGYEDEIAYDDGTEENGLVLNAAGNGLAVRFTPNQYGKLKGANIYFYGPAFPTPGGNRMGFVIYGVNANGQPYQIGEPIFQDIVRGEWNYIDLSSFAFATDGDFYISTMQDKVGTQCPAVGIDQNSAYGDRSYMNIAGSFKLIGSEDFVGALMIRARMEYAMGAPVITNMPEHSYTNQDVITVEGIMAADGIANVYVNGEKVTSVESEDKMFTAQVPLTAEENTISVSAELNGAETELSAPVVVIKDKVAPELTVVNPVDNAKVKVELIHVTGTVSDNIQLSTLKINDKVVEVAENGSFSERVMLVNGANIITVAATDHVGNETIVVRTVISELQAPAITNILPNEDITLSSGQTLNVSFNAPAGGQGYFRLIVPFGMMNKEIGTPMIDNNGLYTGTWTVPVGMEAASLLVEVVYISESGYEVLEVANGKVIIVGNIADLAPNSVIIGDVAYDIEYLNNNASAQAKLIEWCSNGGMVYIKINGTDIVTEDGQQVSIDVLPEILTYFDETGFKLYSK